MAAAEGIARVDRNQVEVAAEAAVLKPVVEHGHVGGPAGRGHDAPHPVAVGHMRHAGQQDSQFGGLVARLTRPGGVAAANHGRSPSSGRQLPGHPGHKRRLARAAECQVADRNHGDRCGVPAKQAQVVNRVAEDRGQAVGGGHQGQGSPQGGGAGADHRSVRQPPEGFRVGQDRHGRARSQRGGDATGVDRTLGRLSPGRQRCGLPGSGPLY
jgi:hypothetical protein